MESDGGKRLWKTFMNCLVSCYHAQKMLKRNDKILLYEQGGRKWEKLWTRDKLLYVSMGVWWAPSA